MEWHELMKLAKELGVTPWQLEEVPLYWLQRAAAVTEIKSRLDSES